MINQCVGFVEKIRSLISRIDMRVVSQGKEFLLKVSITIVGINYNNDSKKGHNLIKIVFEALRLRCSILEYSSD